MFNVLFLDIIHSDSYSARTISIGRINANLEPTPTSEVTEISPPSCWIIILEIVKPRPIPPRLMSLDLDKHPKNRKSFVKSF
jgi:hypothetical protein